MSMKDLHTTIAKSLKSLNKELKHLSYAQNICLLKLPVDLHNHFNISQFYNKKVIILTDQACWIPQLRQHESMILQSLQEIGYQYITTIAWKVSPQLDQWQNLQHAPPKKMKRAISKDALITVEKCASLCQGPETRIQMQKLANTLAKLKENTPHR